MNSLGSFLLSSINKAGQRMPGSWRRRIADFPGILRVFEWLSRDQVRFVTTPEGFALAFNPLLHANLVAGGDLAAYEPGLRSAIARLAQPGMIAYDIGANVGVFSWLFWSLVREKGAVYAFEPEPNNISCFEKTLARNGPVNVILCPQAVGSTPGRARFDRRGGAFSGRLVDEGSDYVPTHNITEVETTSMDALVLEQGLRPPDIVKIDVEGNEGLVLDGMAEVMRRFHPIILCEVHAHLGDPAEQVFERLVRNGYVITGLDGARIDVAGGAGLGFRGHVIAVTPKS
ncbi:MAG: FkbM family methyltransferase [Gammaproteobacteria bacterium]|nr:FkbM family methyltransferase [Gammaproteobacteria bacterium]